MAQELRQRVTIPEINNPDVTELLFFKCLTIRELLLFRRMAKARKNNDFTDFAENLVRKKLGNITKQASTFEYILRWIQSLPKKIQLAVLDCSNPTIWTPSTVRTQLLKTEAQRKKHLIRLFNLTANCAQLFSSTNGMIALIEGLITPQEASKFEDRSLIADPTKNYTEEVNQIVKVLRICVFFSPDKALSVLREKLLTFEQIVTLSENLIRLLLSDNGLAALREGYITAEKINELNRLERLPSSLFNKTLISLRQERAVAIIEDTRNKNPNMNAATKKLITTYSSKLENLYNLLVATHSENNHSPKISAAFFQMTKTIFDESATRRDKQKAIKNFDKLYENIVKNLVKKITVFGLDVTYFRLALFVAAGIAIFAAFGVLLGVLMTIITPAVMGGGSFFATLAASAIGGAIPGALVTGIPAAGMATKLLFFRPTLSQKHGKELTKAAQEIVNNSVDNQGNALHL